MDTLTETNQVTEPEVAPTTDNAPEGEGQGVEEPVNLDVEELGGLPEELAELTKQPEAPELIEIELDGKTYKADPALKDSVLRHGDYTQKTQELSKARKEFEAKVEKFEASSQASEQEQNARIEVAVLDREIQRMSAMSIEGYSQEQINALRMDLRDLQDRKGQIEHGLQALAQERGEQQSQEMTKLQQTAQEQAALKIPNFTDERREQLESLAIEHGASSDDMVITDPGAYEILHYADIGKKFVERQQQAQKMKKAQAGQPQSKVGGASEAGKPAEEMSMDEYIQARTAGKL